MIHRIRDNTRRGITLLEVLTAIFIMGIGLLAILTLFPLGALSMARAVRDDRAATAGANASAMANAMDLRNDPYLVGSPVGFPDRPLSEPPPGYPRPDPNGPGYPVFVDPVFAEQLVQRPVGEVAGVTPGVARTTTDFVRGSSQARARWFTFPDEIAFQKHGQPERSNTNPPTTTLPQAVLRPGTYSWAYLVRRPRSSSPALAELSVIVYAGRNVDEVVPARPLQIPGEPTLTADTTTLGENLMGLNTVTVFYTTTDKPNFRKGGWVMDTSYRTAGGFGTVNGHCYQVAAVTDVMRNVSGVPTPGLTLELETPLKQVVTTLVLMENVVTVIERGTSWKP